MKLKYYFNIDDLTDILFDHLDSSGKLPTYNDQWNIEADISFIVENGEENYAVVLHVEENNDATSFEE